MGSLYRRALQIYNHRPTLRLLRPEENSTGASEALDISISTEGDDSSQEEEKVLAELERAVGESRMRIDDETFRFVPTKKSVLLPLSVNLGALLLVGAAVVVLLYFFDQDRNEIVTNRGAITTAEGQVLEAVRSESEAALSAKDREITDIRSQLASINEEWETIQADAAARLAAQEAELRDRLEAELEAERARLAGEGASESQIASAVAELEAARQEAIEAELATLESELAEELARQEESFRQLQNQYETTLESARAEREAIEEESARRIAELNRQVAEREGELEEERAAAETELEELRSRGERETWVLDQLIARYQSINELVAEGDLEEARNNLQDLREFLREPGIAELPAIQRRLSTETFIISTIEEVIERREVPDNRSAIADVSRLQNVADAVSRANALYEAGETEEALILYRNAIAEIPAVEEAVQRLGEAEDIAETERIAAAESALEAGQGRLSAGDYQRSLEQFRNALSILAAGEVDARVLTEGILSAGTELLREENQRLSESLRQTEIAVAEASRTGASAVEETATPGPSLLVERLDGIEAQLLASAREDDGPRDDLASLLQAKVVTRRILNSEPNRNRYPDLGVRLDGYFDALAAESRGEGRRLALADLAGALSGRSSASLADYSETELWRLVFSNIEALATSYSAEITSE